MFLLEEHGFAVRRKQLSVGIFSKQPFFVRDDYVDRFAGALFQADPNGVGLFIFAGWNGAHIITNAGSSDFAIQCTSTKSLSYQIDDQL